MPGEPYNLYSINNKGGYISTFRLSKECINLSAEEIYSELIQYIRGCKNGLTRLRRCG